MKWFDPNKKKPGKFLSVLGCMTDSGPFPAVRECYRLDDDRYFFPTLHECHPIRLWAEMPLPDDEPTQAERVQQWQESLEEDEK